MPHKHEEIAKIAKPSGNPFPLRNFDEPRSFNADSIIFRMSTD